MEVTTLLFTDTSPAPIKSSASLREHIPAFDKYLFRRTLSEEPLSCSAVLLRTPRNFLAGRAPRCGPSPLSSLSQVFFGPLANLLLFSDFPLRGPLGRDLLLRMAEIISAKLLQLEAITANFSIE
jgi:hypothetical protein